MPNHQGPLQRVLGSTPISQLLWQHWDAFDECLQDVGDWLANARTLTIVLSQSSEVLALEPDGKSFGIFARVMRRIVHADEIDLQFPGENGARAVPIALVVVESADKIGSVEERWSASSA